MIRALPLAALLAAASPALAQTPLSAPAFDALTRGKTFYFAVDGETYGAEQYLPGNKVYWSFLDGVCKTGRWYSEGSNICFTYEDEPEPVCWTFFDTGGTLGAHFAGAPDDERLYATEVSDEPLYCMGPDVGV